MGGAGDGPEDMEVSGGSSPPPLAVTAPAALLTRGCRLGALFFARVLSRKDDCGVQAYTLHPAPYTLHPTPHTDTLHPTPYNLHPTPFTLHSTPHTLHPTPYTLNPEPETRNS